MRVLLIHNKYRFTGGEDTVFESEINLLQETGNTIKALVFNNKELSSFKSKIKYGLYSFYNFDVAKILAKEIESLSPDIIHVHNFFPIASPSIFFIADKYRVPVIMTLHNYRFICPNAMFFRNGAVCELCLDKRFPIYGVKYACYKESVIGSFSLASMIWIHKVFGTWKNKIAKLIVLTNFARNKFIDSKLNIQENKFVIKPNFVEDKGFNLRKDDFCVYVGRLSKEKGIDVLLKAYSRTEKKLHIIGTGPLEKTVRDFSLKNNNVFYHGFKSNDFIIKILKKAKALIFTSLLFEGMPMTILESFSVGTPVICGNIGSPAEIVKDGVNGYHFEVGNYISLKGKIDLLYSNHSKTVELYKNSRKEFEVLYNKKENYKKLMFIYNSVIGEKKKNNKKLYL